MQFHIADNSTGFFHNYIKYLW